MEGQIKASTFKDIVISERKREAIGFAKWIYDNDYYPCLHGKYTNHSEPEGAYYTVEELYQMYLDSL